MSDLYVSWSEYHQKIETLAVKIYQSDWQFNQIVCLARGGLRVGDILCRLYRQPLAILFSASYDGEDNRRQRGKITFSQHLAMTQSNLGNQVLLVDDLVDSGISLAEAVNWLQCNYSSEISAIRTAVIWYKQCSQTIPDYYVDYLEDNPWIYQPFEYYEQIQLAELARQRSKFISSK